jgi:ABC-type sugar transport system, ATPase component
MARLGGMTPTRRPQLQSVLSLRGICKSFGAVHALTDVDLDVKRGEVTALLGDNGAGKSTLVKILAGVHGADAGQISFDGAPVTVSSPTEAREYGIATVYQDLALCNNLDVVSNLFLGREHGRVLLSEERMEEQSAELLAQLRAKLPSLRAAVAGLSGGQRQTVAIARALVGEPTVVILDEPTAALGVEQTSQVLGLIETLRDRGHAVLLITHNMADVQAVADKAAVLLLGRNNGVFKLAETSSEQIVAAITGATDNAVTRRAARIKRAVEGVTDE